MYEGACFRADRGGARRCDTLMPAVNTRKALGLPHESAFCTGPDCVLSTRLYHVLLTEMWVPSLYHDHLLHISTVPWVYICWMLVVTPGRAYPRSALNCPRTISKVLWWFRRSHCAVNAIWSRRGMSSWMRHHAGRTEQDNKTAARAGWNSSQKCAVQGRALCEQCQHHMRQWYQHVRSSRLFHFVS